MCKQRKSYLKYLQIKESAQSNPNKRKNLGLLLYEKEMLQNYIHCRFLCVNMSFSPDAMLITVYISWNIDVNQFINSL